MKFLICGVGSIGLRHLKNLKALGHTDILLHTTGKSCMPGYDEHTEGLPKYAELAKALAEKPDVCMVTNPSSMHVETALQAAEAGCHLYIEKPLCDSLEGLDRLLDATRSRDLVTFVTYQFRFHPHLVLLRDIFRQGGNEFGLPLYVTSEWSEYLPDWHPWEDYRQGYSARRELGGGVLLTQVHPLNYLHFIFGEISSIQINQAATGSLGIDVDDVADILVRFTSGLAGHVHVDYLQKPRVHTMKIVTTKGRFEWDCHANRLAFIDTEGSAREFSIDGFERNDMFMAMLAEYIDCVEKHKKTRFELSEAVTEARLLLNPLGGLIGGERE